MRAKLYERARLGIYITRQRLATWRDCIGNWLDRRCRQDDSPATMDALEPRLYMSGNTSGYTFLDADRDGIRDAGETVITGVPLFVDDNNDGFKNLSDRESVSDNHGHFDIADSSDKSIKAQLPDGWASYDRPGFGKDIGLYFDKSETTSQADSLTVRQSDGINPITQSTQASWSFDDMPEGDYEVFVTWNAQDGPPLRVEYTVFDGLDQESRLLINQTVSPEGDSHGGHDWQSIGIFHIDSAELKVELDRWGASAGDAIRVVSRTERPNVWVESNQKKVMEGESASFTVRRDGSMADDLVVNYSLAGGAQSSLDFRSLAGSVVIAAGQSSTSIDLTTKYDGVYEGGELLSLSLNAGNRYQVKGQSADIEIDDADRLPVISVLPTIARVGKQIRTDHSFTLQLSHASSRSIVVDYVIANDKISRDLLGAWVTDTVVFQPGETVKHIDVAGYEGEKLLASGARLNLKHAAGAVIASQRHELLEFEGYQAATGTAENVIEISGTPYVEEGAIFQVIPQWIAGTSTITDVTIDWGDGNQDNYSSLPSEFTHVYFDDNPSRTVVLSYTDGVGTSQSDPITVEVVNTVPDINLDALISADEAAIYDVNFTIGDIGTDTVTDILIDWGDGASESLGFSATSASHTYPDGPYVHDLVLTVVDEDGAHAFGSSAGPWQLDRTFDSDGHVTTSGGYGSALQSAEAFAEQADGKLVVAGWTTNYDFAVARYNADGSLDPSFGTDGVTTFDYNGGTDRFYDVIVQENGKILAGGTSSGYGIVARLDALGTLDQSFGSSGIVNLNAAGFYGSYSSIAIDPDPVSDSEVFVAGDYSGMHVVKLDTSGNFDTSFGSAGTGIVYATDGYAAAIGLQSDGKIIIGGDSYYGSMLAVRVLTDGTVDTANFGTSGVATMSFPGNSANAGGMVIDSQDRIALGGWAINADNHYDFGVARFNADGSADTEFGTNGALLSNVATDTGEYGYGIGLTQDDGLIIHGEVYNPDSGNLEYTAAVYTSDGTRDFSFDNDGLYFAGGTSMKYIRAAGGASGGDLVLVGEADGYGGGFAVTRFSKQIPVVVNNIAPTLSLDGQSQVDEGKAYVLQLSHDDPGLDTITEWEIDWGDGSVQTIQGDPSFVTHIYADGDHDYIVTATATDEDGTWAFGGGGNAGELNTAFGGGQVSVEAGYWETVREVAVQDDGKVVAAAYGSPGTYEIYRFDTDGTLDQSFGTGGVTTVGVAGYGEASSIVLLTDGSMIVGGFDNGVSGVSLIRLDSSGLWDTSFGSSGIGSITIGNPSFYDAPNMAIQSDGKIVVAVEDGSGSGGTHLVRFDASGNEDTSFTTTYVSWNASYPGSEQRMGLTLQSDDSIIVAGMKNSDNVVLSRVLTNGGLDTTFGTSGSVETNLGSTEGATDVAVLTDDSIVVAAYGAGTSDFNLLRYTADGVLDYSINQPFVGLFDLATQIEVQSNDKIILAGYGYSPGWADTDFLVARFNIDGSLDATFNANGSQPGVAQLDFDGDYDEIHALAIGPHGSIVVGGRVYVGGSDNLGLAMIDGGIVGHTVTVNNVAPTIELSGDLAIATGQLYDLTWTSFDPGDDTITDWRVHWSDPVGTFDSFTDSPAINSATHTFNTPGSYTVYLEADDEDGTFQSESLVVTVNDGSSSFGFYESGGTANGRGDATELNDQLTLTEGDSFYAVITQDVTVNSNSIKIQLSNLNFDTTATGDMGDALELALVDADGRSLVGTIHAGRDSFFNLTDGQTELLGGSVAYDDQTGIVTLDVSHLPAGTTATLLARLVNNDGDTGTAITIDSGVTASASTVTGATTATATNADTYASDHAIDFALLSDVTSSMAVSYGVTSFNEESNVLYTGVAIDNVGSYSLRDPLLLVIERISNSSVRALNPDGFTPDGRAYLDLSGLVFTTNGNFDATDTFDPGETPVLFDLPLTNPNGDAFDIEFSILGRINSAPTITSTPNKLIEAGSEYEYQVIANDVDADDLIYSLTSAPTGMTIDATGKISWTTQIVDTGTQGIRVEVSDGHGKKAVQSFSLNVVDSIPNRPPAFTSTPIVDAYVGVDFGYLAQAVDADGDTLTYTVDTNDSPQGFSIDGQTGLTSWVPDSSLVGQFVRVTLEVTDGSLTGGTAAQPFDVLIHDAPGNHDPLIVSDPPAPFELLEVTQAQIAGGTVETTSSGLSAIRGQVWLDVNGNGFRDAGLAADVVELTTPGTVIIPAEDDASSGILDLGFTLELYGNNYTQFYVNNNGNITFDGPLTAYVPIGFEDNDIPMIAPFWADVDTRGAASGEARFTTGTTSRGNAFIQVDWPDVGYYSVQTDKLNDFTLWIEDDPQGDIVAFVYRNMEWTTGFNGTNGFGNPGAQIGFDPGVGTDFLSFQRPVNASDLIPYNNNTILFRLNGGGFPDAALEPGIDAFSVELVDPVTGDVVAEQVSRSLDLNSDLEIDSFTEVGSYRFENLTPGDYDIRVLDKNGFLQSSVSPSTITVAADEIAHAEFGLSRVLYYPVQAIDPDGDTLSYSLISGPTGTSVDSQTGELSWFTNTPGTYAFEIEVSDGRGGLTYQSFDLEVVPDDLNVAPQITSAAPTIAGADRIYSYTVQSIDANRDPLTYDLDVFPQGMTINPTTGHIQWTPDSNDIGATNDVTVSVTDSSGAIDTQSFTIDVSQYPPNTPPQFNSTPRKSAVVGQRYRYRSSIFDDDGDALSFDLSLRPEGMEIQGFDGEVIWWPNEGDIGEHEVVIRVRDSRGEFGFQAFTLEVRSPNSAPVIASIENVYTSTAIGQLIVPVVVADPDGDLVTLSLDQSSIDLGMTVGAQNDFIEWSNVVIGNHRVTILADDGRGERVGRSFTISVGSNGPATITSEPPAVLTLGDSYSYSITTEDPDGDPVTLTLDNASIERGMSLSGGILSWQADQLGVFPVSITVADSNGTGETQSFVLRVVEPVVASNPPVFHSKPTGPAEVGIEYAYDVTATDSDVGDTVILSLYDDGVNPPPVGMTFNPSAGELRWTLVVGDVGSHLVQILAQDNNGVDQFQSFTLDVTDQPSSDVDPSISSIPTGPAVANQQYVYQVNATDPNNDPLTYALSDAPVGASIDASGLLKWTPTVLGDFGFTIDVSDGTNTTSQVFILPVVSSVTLNEMPVITSTPTGPTALDGSYGYQVVAEDPNGDALTYSLIDGPVGATIDGNGLLQWDADVSGTASFTIRVTDSPAQGTPRHTDQSFDLVILDNAPPTITSNPVSQITNVGELFTYAINAHDPNGDDVTLSLADPESGMTLTSTGSDTADLTWTPGTPGVYRVQVDVTDEYGESTHQVFDLRVIDNITNDAPSIVSSPRQVIALGDQWIYQVDAIDSDADELSYELAMDEFPDGMTVDNFGLVTWTPVNFDTGRLHSVRLVVSDGRGETDEQSFDLFVSAEPVNTRPAIDSAPAGVAIVNTPYTYQATATDADHDPLIWELVAGPQGMTLNADTGLVSWVPDVGDGGGHLVSVRVVDTGGLGEIQTYVLTVRGVNVPPQIVSTPVTSALMDEAYVYDVDAIDLDVHDLTYSIDAATQAIGLSIDPNTGVIQGSVATAGTHTVRIEVTDGFVTNVQGFDLVVVDPAAANLYPQITSEANYVAIVGGAYQYQVIANDPNNDGLIYSVDAGSQALGISIDSNGLVTWTPAIGDVGSHQIEVTVTDDNAAPLSWTQAYALNVDNDAPTIADIANRTIEVGNTVILDVVASETNGDLLSYALTVSPAGMTIDANGRIQWSVDADDITDGVGGGPIHDVTVQVTDEHGAYDTGSFAVTVAGDVAPPSLSLTVSNNNPVLGDTLTISVEASDNVGVDSLTLIVDGQYVPIVNGIANVVASRAGVIFAIAAANDAAGNGPVTGQILIDVSNPDVVPSNATPIVGIVTPDGTTVTAPTDILGVVYDTDAGDTLNYTLEIAPINSSDFSFIHQGSTQHTTTAPIGRLDPTLMANGTYLLRLTATDVAGEASVIESSVNIDGRLKLGNFRLSFNDLSIPVVGVPITIGRTYDTLNANVQGDFGYGWQLDLLGIGVSTDVESTESERSDGYQGFRTGQRLYVTLPDGTREGFTFLPKPLDPPTGFGGTAGLYATNLVAGVGGLFQPRFVADPGNTATLDLSADHTIKFDEVRGQWIDGSRTAFNPADPALQTNYIVNTNNGTRFVMEGAGGTLKSISDRNGNQLRVSNGGVTTTSAAGVETAAVTFIRDQHGRIIAVKDPNGESISYSYDSAGDLVAVTQRGDTTATTIEYDSLTSGGRDHFLMGITDPRGIDVLSLDFDDDGRLQSLTDASGNAVPFSYSLDRGDGTFVETLQDADDVATDIVRDEWGNVVRTIQHVPDDVANPTSYTYIVTLFEYDNASQGSGTSGGDNRIRESVPFEVPTGEDRFTYTTDPIIWRSQNEYDANRNVTLSRDALGNETRTTYDSFGNVLSTTDALGNTSSNSYDLAGNLTDTTDALGHTTTFGYDTAGNLNAVLDSNGVVLSTFTYDEQGRIAATTASGGTTTYLGYDANGNQTHSWSVSNDVEGSGLSSTIASLTVYDGQGRVTGTHQYDLENQSITTFAALLTALASATALTSSTTTYNANGQVDTTTNAFGFVTENHYNARGQLVQTRRETDDEAGQTQWLVNRTIYDDNGRPVYQTDTYVEGTTDAVAASETVYDALGRVIETRRREYVTVTVTQSNGIYETSIAPGNEGAILWSTTTTYDAQGRIARSEDRTGAATEYLFNARGDLIETRSQNKDKNGTLRWIVNRSLYDALGRVTHATDAYVEGVTTDITGSFSEYDDLGRAFKTHRVHNLIIDITGTGSAAQSVLTDPGDITLTNQTTYDNTGRVTKSIAANGGVTDYEYDAIGRQTAVIGPVFTDASPNGGNPVRSRTESIYDTQGRVHTTRDNIAQDPTTRVIDATNIRETSFTYDAFNRVTRTDFADDTFTTTTYDKFGRRTAETDQMGQMRTFEYDESGRVVAVNLPQVEDPLNNDTLTNPRYEYAYDARGNHVSIIDPNGHETRLAYDHLGRQISRTLPLGVLTPGDPDDFTEQTTYDDLGRAASHTSFEGRITAYVYDDTLGGGERMTDMHYFANQAAYDAYLVDPVANPPAETTMYNYDALGRMHSTQTTSDGLTTYQYDAEGRQTQVASPQGTIDFAYNALGQLTETATSNTVTQYAYDLLGRVSDVTTTKRLGESVTPETTQYVYDLVGRIDVMLTPNGVTTDYVYDELGRVQALNHFIDFNFDNQLDANDHAIATFYYDLRADGQRIGELGQMDTDGDGSFDETYSFFWVYDALNRLIKEQHLSVSTTNYVYDLAGNRVEMSVSHQDATQSRTVTYTLDANDRLLTETSDHTHTTEATHTVYTYDVTEQIGKKVYDGLDDTGMVESETTYSYNLQGRLSHVQIDSDGDTVAATETDYVYNANGTRVQQSISENGGTPVVHDYLVDENNLTGYAQVLEETIDAVLAVAYTIGLDVIAQAKVGVQNGDPLYFLHDAHGSTRALIDELAAVIETYAFDAYGNALDFDPAAALTTLLYSGEQFDAKIAMQYLRARYYDASVGRFNRLDPFFGNLDNPQSLNKYLYTHGNPIAGIDPTGLYTLNELLVVVGKQVAIVTQQLSKSLTVTTRALKVIVRASIIANLLYGMTDPKLMLFVGLSTSYNWKQIRKFNKIPIAKLQAKLIRRVISIGSLAANNLIRYQKARAKGFVVSIKPTGFIDFSNYVHPARGTVFIKLTGSRDGDARKADRARGLPRPRDYAWHHHEVMGIMQLVRKDVHNPQMKGLGHKGGAFYWVITNNKDGYRS